MSLTRKKLKLTKKTLFLYQKSSYGPVPVTDPTGGFTVAPNWPPYLKP